MSDRCSLRYCNAHASLQGQYCNGAECTTSAQAAACLQHFVDNGSPSVPNPMLSCTTPGAPASNDCSLQYCNAHLDLQNAYCNGVACTTPEQVRPPLPGPEPSLSSYNKVT